MDSQTTKKVNNATQGIETIDLLELIRVLWGYVIWIVLTAIACGGLLGAYIKYYTKPTYSAEALIYIANTDSVLNMQDIQISAALTQDYANIMKSRNVLKKVIADQKLSMTYADLGKMVSISNPKDTHILKIAVTSATPELSIRIANSLLKYGIDTIFKTIGNDEPSIIDMAEADAITVNKQSTVKLAAIGGILGAMLVCGIVFLKYVLDTTVHDEDDVKELALPVLAEIPEYYEKLEERSGRRNRKNGRK